MIKFHTMNTPLCPFAVIYLLSASYICGPYSILLHFQLLKVGFYILYMFPIRLNKLCNDQVSKQKVSYRKLKTIDIDKFILDCNLNDINTTDLDKVVEHFHKNLSNSLNLNTPIKTKLVTIHHRVPWFTEGICEQKRVVRRYEKLWRKYRTNDMWKAFKIEKSRYQQQLKQAKTEVLTEEIIDCNMDSKKLFDLVSNITGTAEENPLPECSSDK